MNYDYWVRPAHKIFLMMRERPQTPLVGKKKKFSLFLGFDFETSELAFFEKVIFDFLVRLIIFLNLVRWWFNFQLFIFLDLEKLSMVLYF